MEIVTDDRWKNLLSDVCTIVHGLKQSRCDSIESLMFAKQSYRDTTYSKMFLVFLTEIDSRAVTSDNAHCNRRDKKKRKTKLDSERGAREDGWEEGSVRSSTVACSIYTVYTVYTV